MGWLRLDQNWDDSEWVYPLSAGSQLAWVKLLCHCKRDGRSGHVKALGLAVAAKKWGVGLEDVEKLLMAAQTHGALSVADGVWAVNQWKKYQEPDNTNAERQSRFKAKKTVTDGNAVTPVTNAVTRRVTSTSTSTNTEEPPKSPSGELDFIELLPEGHRTVAVREAFEGFQTMRRENHWKPWKEQTLRQNAKRFAAFPPEVVAEAFRNSALNQYQGVFPDRITTKTERPKTVQGMAAKAIQEMQDARQHP